MPRFSAFALILGLVLPIAGAGPGLAQDAGRINDLIQSLEPAGADARQSPAYTNRIEELHLPAGSGGGSAAQNRYILNYNHTVDLEIYFDFNSDTITPKAAAELDLLGRALTSSELDGFIYLLAGHTDARGAADYNQSLSERRALAARLYLLDEFPIDAERLVAVGLGEERLRDSQQPRSAVNRRVEVTLIETGDMPAVSGLAPKDGSVGNVVCETSPVALDDPRPPRNDLDDFGGVRTPVDCETLHNQLESADTGPAPSGDMNAVIQE